MSILSLCDGLPWILFTADTRSTYDPPPNVYTETLVKLSPHLFLRTMEWLHILCHFYPTYFSFHLLQEMAHGSRQENVPDRCGKTNANCNNLIPDHNMCNDAKRGTFINTLQHLCTKNCHNGLDFFSISVGLNSMVKAESSCDIWAPWEHAFAEAVWMASVVKWKHAK